MVEPEMKVVYIAHLIGGDVQGNVEKVKGIIKHINLTRTNIVPFAPYIVDLLVLDDTDPDQRERGIANNDRLFDIVEEVWVFGMSPGVQREIDIAVARNLKVRYVSMELQPVLKFKKV